MKRIRLTILLFFFVFLNAVSGKSQDVHFSQFYAAPLYLNPALTGYFPCIVRFGLNYRSQWAGMLPFKTQDVWGDGKINKHFFRNDWFGIGGMVYGDDAGGGLMKNTKFMLNAAYHKGLFRNNMFNTSIGFSFGMVNRSVSTGNLVFDNQWNGSTFSPSGASGENFGKSSFYFFDLNAGILITYKKSRYDLFFGGSLNHITKPDISITGNNEKMGMRPLVHGGASLHRKKLKIKPQFMFSTQDRATELIFGANFIYNYKGVDLYFGLFDRFSGDAIPTLGFDWKGWVFMFTYDVNYQPYLVNLTGFKGGWELSLHKTFGCNDNGGVGGGGMGGKSGKRRDHGCPAYN